MPDDSSTLQFDPTRREDIPLLRSALLHEAVYRHLGGLPSVEAFDTWLERDLAGPPPADAASGEKWLSFCIRLRTDQVLVGRLEANLHDGICEIACLLAPGFHGQGYGSASLRWLHAEILRSHRPAAFWASTAPENRACERMLLATGYRLASAPPTPHLFSRDDGDLVFRRSAP